MSTPTVTAVVTAFDCERFVGEALDSALGQDYPADRLDVVVVDDGSTDGTAAEIARRAAAHPARVRVIRQPNAGYVAATNRGLAAATGELIALLDADDAWPADKLRRQVALLTRRPEVGLVYGDMTVVDAGGAVLQPSWLEDEHPPEGRDVAGLLAGNVATSSSIVIRGALARRLGPVPAEIAFADWWLAVRAAQESAIAYLPEPRTRYRFHGANMSLGTDGAKRAEQLRASLALQRWFLRRMAPGVLTAAEMRLAWSHVEAFARELQAVLGSPFAQTIAVTEADHAAALRLLAEAGPDDGLLAYLQAAAADPWCAPARAALAAAG